MRARVLAIERQRRARESAWRYSVQNARNMAKAESPVSVVKSTGVITNHSIV
jgi:hypothetical protein